MAEEEDSDDPLPFYQAKLDQGEAMAPMIAHTMAVYFRAFVAEGFTEAQACYLVIAQMFQNPGTPP